MPQTISDPIYLGLDKAPWVTGFFKSPVAGWIEVGTTNLQGDGQADKANHGGIDKAILVYSFDHFDYWSETLDGRKVSAGMFGENLTVNQLDESSVCIGDHFKINDVTLEVSQPRQPCWKLGRRWQLGILPRLVVKSGYCGWYCRVIQTGKIQAGLPIELVKRVHPEWTIRRAHETMFDKTTSPEEKEKLRSIPELSRAWKADL